MFGPIVTIFILLNSVNGYDYSKFFQSFKHEVEADIMDFESIIEESDFKLDHVVSGRDARSINIPDQTLLFDLSLLQIPEEIPSQLPKHKIQYTTDIGYFMDQYSNAPFEPAKFLKGSPSLIPRPDDYQTVTNFAMMCSNAYIIHSILGDWRNMTDWNEVSSYL